MWKEVLNKYQAGHKYLDQVSPSSSIIFSTAECINEENDASSSIERKINDMMQRYDHNMNKRLDEISKQILLLNRDRDMEEEYPELKEAYDQYNDLLSKLKTFKALKESS